jgi:hypothetical protein
MSIQVGDIVELDRDYATTWAKTRLKFGVKYEVEKISNIQSVYLLGHSGGFKKQSFKVVSAAAPVVIKKPIKINLV